MGLARYMALARVDDLPHAIALGTDLEDAAANAIGPICLLQCGTPSPLATELGRLLTAGGRRVTAVVLKDRATAQAPTTLEKLAIASAVWIFADDLLGTFFDVFATDTTFLLRARAKESMPVVGIGKAALALGGLLLANKICGRTEYELVSGLGWAPRVLIDGGEQRDERDADIARATVSGWPGLLGMDLGQAGGVRVDGGRIESVGSESVILSGAGTLEGETLAMELEPGRFTIIAPPPFAPFERGLLPADTVEALARGLRRTTAASAAATPLRQVPAAPAPRVDTSGHAPHGGGRVCPMCKKVHGPEPARAAAAA
ncbi:MAG: hypothetical protein NVSMB2_23890 [Chloroflexota bacterium]